MATEKPKIEQVNVNKVPTPLARKMRIIAASSGRRQSEVWIEAAQRYADKREATA